MIDLRQGDCLERMAEIEDGMADLILTSPPYNLGKEYEKRDRLDKYLGWQDVVIAECLRVMSDAGSICWQVGNYIEDGEVFPLDVLLYNSFKRRGLKLRNRIVWEFGHGLHCSKRFSGRHETILWFTKGDAYAFDLDAVRVPQKYPNKKHYKGPKKGQLSGNPLGKNPGDVWVISNVKHNHPEKTMHPCQFPERLVARLVKSLTRKGDLVIDPFMGSGTTGVVCARLGRHFIGIEKNQTYCEIAENRIAWGEK